MSLFTPLVNKVYKAATTPDARGMFTSSFENYLKNYYGPTPKVKEVAEKTTGTFGMGGQEVMAGAKALGLAEGALSGVGNFLKMQDPYNAAVYRTGGVNPTLMKEAPRKDVTSNVQGSKNPEKNIPVREQEEYVARGIYNLHQGEQAGREGAKSPTLQNLEKNISIGGYVEMQPNFYNRALKVQNKSVPGQAATKEDAKFIEEYMMDVWKQRTLTQRVLSKLPNVKLEGTPFKYNSSNKFIIKAPNKKKSGNHREDLVSRKGKLKEVSVAVFQQGNPKSVEELAKRIEDTGLVKIQKIDKDGVYFSYSMQGRGITEGGINLLVKLKPNGKGFGVVSDEHDFLEFLPPVRGLVQKRLLAATPPINFNVRKQFPDQLNIRNNKTKKETNKKKDKATWEDLPEAYSKQYVDPDILKQEQIKALLKAAGIGGAGYQTMKED